jgi:U3 small nucleolar ribonucleoprotein component
MGYTFLSPVSVEYLKKIKELASRYNFKLIILPTPLSSAYKTRVEKLNRKEITDNNFDNEFKDFFEKIIYLDQRYFSDSSHLINPAVYTEIYKNNFLK